MNLGNALLPEGELDEAIACYRRVLELKPDYVEAYSNLVFAINFSPDYDARTIYEENCRWNRQFAAPLTGLIQPHGNQRSANRRLRIGYVSPALRNGATALFLLPLLEAHDHDRFEIFCYASAPQACGVVFHHPRRRRVHRGGAMRASLYWRYSKYSGLTCDASTSSMTGRK